MQLDNKPETLVTNLDKSPLTFSKKHSFILNENLADFYTVKTRKPITDDKAVVHVMLCTSSSDIVCEPS